MSTVSERGITIRRAVVADGGTDMVVEFEIESTHQIPVAVRVCDMPPAEHDILDILPYCEGENGDWRHSNGRLEFSAVLAADGTITTGYSVPEAGDTSLQLLDSPSIEAVQPVDPELLEESGVTPLWRSASSMSVGEPTSVVELPVESRRTTAPSPFIPRYSEVTPTLSVVIPTLNEEEGIADCIDAVERAVERLDMTTEVIVSDSSTDRTPEIAREKGAIVVKPDQPGYGYAYRYGFGFVRGEYVVIGDADMTYDFEDIPRLLGPISKGAADIVMGSRFRGQIEPGAMPALHQHIGNPLLTKFLNTFYDAGVTDAHSGFRVLRREVVENLELQSNGMEFASEMVMVAAVEGLTIEEVPITYHKRKGEATLSSFRDGWRHVRFMLTNAPTYLFSVPAIGLGLLSVLVMTMSLFKASFSGIFFGTHMIIAGSLLAIIGYQVGNLALFSSIAANPIREQQDPATGWIRRNVNLEHALTLGSLLFLVGSGYVVYLFARWVMSGYTDLPSISEHIVGFTAVVLGVQTVFSAFFLSMLGRRRHTSVAVDDK